MQFAVFLRAINVGRANRVRMDALRALCEDAGLGPAATYLQTGNLVISTGRDAEDVAATLEGALAASRLNNVAAMVRSRDELAAVVAACPFDAYDPGRFRRLVAFYRWPLPGSTQSTLADTEGVVAVLDREVLTVSDLGVPARSDASALLARKLRQNPATTRYWNVAQAVLELLD